MEKNLRRYIYLASATAMMLFAGIIYAWSILKTPFLSEFNWTQGALGLNFTVTMWCFCFGGIIGGVLVQKIPLRIIILISSVMTLLGFWLTGSLDGGSVWQLYITYGVLCGLGIGIVYTAVMPSVIAWFPDKRASVSGVLMMGFGISSLVLGSITGRLLNAMDWSVVYRGLGVCGFIIFAAGSMLIKPPPPDMAHPPDSSQTGDSFTAAEMIRKSSFWRLYIYLILVVSVGSCAISFAKDIAVSAGTGEAPAIFLTGALSVCNGLGRISSGILFDRIGSKKTMRLTNASAIMATVLLLLASPAGGVVLTVFGLSLAGLSYGLMTPFSAGLVGKLFGRKNFAANFSIVNTMMIFSSFSATVGGWIYEGTGKYTAMFVFLFVFAISGSVLGETLHKAGS